MNNFYAHGVAQKKLYKN